MNNKDFIFIHIPKTAGTSISNALQIKRSHKPLRYFLHFKKRYLLNKNINFLETGRILFNDKNLISGINNFMGISKKNNINKYKTFSVIRNPWSRTLSWYLGMKRYKPNRISNNLPDNLPFEEFVFKHHKKISALLPQTYWLINWEGNIDLDLIARQENLKEDWTRICDLLKINIKLPNLNSSPEKYKLSDYYNRDTQKFITEKYSKEIKLFNYNFDEY